MKKYVVSIWQTSKPMIKVVEVERETQSTIIISSVKKMFKKTSSHEVFDTFEEAKEKLIALGKSRLVSAENNVRAAQTFYELAVDLKQENIKDE